MDHTYPLDPLTRLVAEQEAAEAVEATHEGPTDSMLPPPDYAQFAPQIADAMQTPEELLIESEIAYLTDDKLAHPAPAPPCPDVSDEEHRQLSDVHEAASQRNWSLTCRKLDSLRSRSWDGASDAQKASLLCNESRMLLMMGATREAALRAASALSLGRGDLNSTAEAQTATGLVLVAEEQYEQAFQYFSAAAATPGLRPGVMLAAANGEAVTCVFLGNLPRAMEVAVGLIRRGRDYMTRETIFNLSTIYELTEEQETSDRRKRALQTVVERAGVALGADVFKLS